MLGSYGSEVEEMSATIRVDVSEALRKIDPKDMERAISSALTDAANILRADMQRYPPPKPTYQQTGTLGRGWTAPEITGMQVIVGNNVAYGPYVQDSDTQAWMHKGRWQTVQDVAQKRAEDVKRIIEDTLARWAA